jgi:hypothetical protein
MKTLDDLRLAHHQLHGQLLPILIGRVFHATSVDSLEEILASGEIRANVGAERKRGFGYAANSFFRKRGCVSLFDYHSPSVEQIEASIYKCSPYRIPRTDRLAYLFLAQSEYHRLLPWTRWEEAQAWSDQIIPHVEAGHFGAIPMTSIEAVLRVFIVDELNAAREFGPTDDEARAK